MADYRAAWLIGSIYGMPQQEVTCDGVPVLSNGSNYYLYDADFSLSLVDLIRGMMITAGIVGAIAGLQRNGLVYLEAAGVFTISWGVSTVLRDLLGFTGNLAGASKYTAPLKSPLLWMPGKPETPMMQRLGVVGHRVPTVYQAVSAYSGRAESVSHGSRIYARYSFPMVDSDLVVTTGNEGGTFARWFDEVAVKAARFKLYRDVLENPTSTATAASYLDEPLGPYVFTAPAGKGPAWAYDMSRGFERTDKRADIDIRCHVVEEMTT